MKANPFHEASLRRVQTAAHTAGLTGAFSNLLKGGPQVLALQQELLDGIGRAHAREAARLADAGRSKEDPRVRQLAGRSREFEQVAAELSSNLALMGRAVQTFQTDGIFPGYVIHADGTPAADHQVRLRWRAAAAVAGNDKLPTALERTASTDAEGYFRVELAPQAKDDARTVDVKLNRDVLARMAALMDAEPEAATAAAPAAPAAATVANASEVQVFDSKGTLVLEDPMPPTFEHMSSDLRWYVLGMDGPADPLTPGEIKRR
jgi:hypothetical protein